MDKKQLWLGVMLGIGGYITRKLEYILKNVFSYAVGQIFFKVTIESDSKLFDALNEWYMDNYESNFRVIRASFDTTYTNGLPVHKLKITPVTSISIIDHKGNKMLLTKSTDEYMTDDGTDITHTYVITGYRAETVKSFLNFLEEYYNRYRRNKGLCVIVQNDYGAEFFYKKVTKTFDDLFFEGKERLIKYIDEFESQEELFRKRKIKYKTGILLAGIPGSGKSETAFAIADYTRRNAYYVSMRNFANDSEFQNFIMEVPEKSMVIMEDVDDFFGDRESDSAASKTVVSFSSILNTLDGVFSPHNCLIVMTTNKPNSLDEALLRRGRLDFKLFFDYPKGKYVNEFVSHYYNTPVRVMRDEDVFDRPMVDVEGICRAFETPREILKHWPNINE